MQKIQIHKGVFIRKTTNLVFIFLFFFCCKQEHNLKTDKDSEQNKTSLFSMVSDPKSLTMLIFSLLFRECLPS